MGLDEFCYISYIAATDTGGALIEITISPPRERWVTLAMNESIALQLSRYLLLGQDTSSAIYAIGLELHKELGRIYTGPTAMDSTEGES